MGRQVSNRKDKSGITTGESAACPDVTARSDVTADSDLILTRNLVIAASRLASGVEFPPDVRFGDDREGIEARMLLSGYADYLGDAVRNHEPVQKVREIVERIVEVTTNATLREMSKLVAQANGRPN